MSPTECAPALMSIRPSPPEVPLQRVIDPVWRRLIVLVVVTATFITWLVTRNSFFFADDLLFFQLAELSPLSIEELRRPNFGHFGPISTAWFQLFQNLFPMDWRVAHLFTTTVFLGCLATFAVLVRRLAGTGPASYAAVAWAGMSIFGVKVLDWWSASLHIFFSLLFTLLCLVLFVRWHQEGRARDRWLSVGVFMAALLVQERPLLIPLYLAGLRYLLLVPVPLSIKAFLAQVRRDLRLWVPYFVVFVAAFANIRAFYSENSGTPELGLVARFLRFSVFEGFLPGLVGTQYGQHASDVGWQPPFALGQWIGGLLLLGLVTGSLATRRAGRAWFFAAAVYLVNMAGLVAGRSEVFDPLGRAVDPQYYVEVHLFFCLGLAMAYGAERKRAPLGWNPNVLKAVGIAMAVVVAVGFGLGARDFKRLNGSPRTVAAYARNVEDGLAALHRDGGPAEVLPVRAPGEVAFSFIVPYDDHETFLRLFPDPPRNDVDSPRKYVFDRSGTLRPVGPYRWELAAGPGRFDVTGAVRVPPRDSGGERCFVPEAETGVGVPLKARHSGGVLFAALEYRTEADQLIRLAQDVGGGDIKYRSFPHRLPAGRHVAYVRLESEIAEKVFLFDLAPGAEFCLRSLDLVSLVYTDKPGPDGECPQVGRIGEEVGPVPCDGKFRTVAGAP